MAEHDALTLLVERIEHLLALQPRVTVAISGFGGSGKTTLANQLRDHFAFTDVRSSAPTGCTRPIREAACCST